MDCLIALMDAEGSLTEHTGAQIELVPTGMDVVLPLTLKVTRSGRVTHLQIFTKTGRPWVANYGVVVTPSSITRGEVVNFGGISLTFAKDLKDFTD